MLREYDTESKKDVTRLFLCGYIQFNSSVMSEKALYDKYKAKEAIVLDPRVRIEMEILEILEGLGFPMEEIGTFFYKDLIASIVTKLSFSPATRSEIEDSLESEYSQLYFDVARNDLDIGIKSFREYVNLAFANINLENANPELLESVIAEMENAISNNQLPLVIAEHTKTINFGQSRVRVNPETDNDEAN